MLKQILNSLFITLLMFDTAFATEVLFKVSTSGMTLEQPVNFTLCLNIAGPKPISCQNYHTERNRLTINTTIPGKKYYHAGIKINTPGYTYNQQGIRKNVKINKIILSDYINLSALSDLEPAIGTIGLSSSAYTVAGTIVGLTGTVVLSNNANNSTSISTDGPFTFSSPIRTGESYRVEIETQPIGQTCTVANGTGIMGNANINNVIVTCAMRSYTIGGSISGLFGSLILLNNGGDPRSINANGPFTFSTQVAQGSTYNVTVQTQPSSQTCTISNGTGTVSGSNITNVNVICSTHTHHVGGTITGLIGTVTLLNNGNDIKPVSTNGPFVFSTPVAEGGAYNTTIQTQPADQTCDIAHGSGIMGNADVTNIEVNCITHNTTISVNSNATIPVNAGRGTLIVTNTGTNYTAYNVHAILPGGWIGVSQDASHCVSIAPHHTCTLFFTSTTPYVANGSVQVTGDNVTSSPTTALAFSINDYLVWSVSGSSPTATALVVANDDAIGSPVIWSANNSGSYDGGVSIWGIAENSTTTSPYPNAFQPAGKIATQYPGQQNCNGSIDGLCNTNNTYIYYQNHAIGQPIPTSYYAAGLCYKITADNSGIVPAGTWYLPAICQLGVYSTQSGGNDAGCGTNKPSIQKNLYKYGFLSNLDNTITYWSSTEFAVNPQSGAWFQYFVNIDNSSQGFNVKNNEDGVRCIRAFTY